MQGKIEDKFELEYVTTDVGTIEDWNEGIRLTNNNYRIIAKKGLVSIQVTVHRPGHDHDDWFNIVLRMDPDKGIVSPDVRYRGEAKQMKGRITLDSVNDGPVEVLFSPTSGHYQKVDLTDNWEPSILKQFDPEDELIE